MFLLCGAIWPPLGAVFSILQARLLAWTGGGQGEGGWRRTFKRFPKTGQASTNPLASFFFLFVTGGGGGTPCKTTCLKLIKDSAFPYFPVSPPGPASDPRFRISRFPPKSLLKYFRRVETGYRLKLACFPWKCLEGRFSCTLHCKECARNLRTVQGPLCFTSRGSRSQFA